MEIYSVFSCNIWPDNCHSLGWCECAENYGMNNTVCALTVQFQEVKVNCIQHITSAHQISVWRYM